MNYRPLMTTVRFISGEISLSEYLRLVGELTLNDAELAREVAYALDAKLTAAPMIPGYTFRPSDQQRRAHDLAVALGRAFSPSGPTVLGEMVADRVCDLISGAIAENEAARAVAEYEAKRRASGSPDCMRG